MRTFIIAGNWKMNTSLEEAITLAGAVRDAVGSVSSVERVLIPPFPWIIPVKDAVGDSGITVGAQTCYHESSGAFTGEVSPVMLAPYCSHVVLGHSERRHILGESDEAVAARLSAALETSLRPILCVGETLEQREAGQATDVVASQLRSALGSISAQDMSRVVIAYEPVWAIGTGVAASANDAQEMAAFVRYTISQLFSDAAGHQVQIQYGGSVKASNAAELMACPDIDGALVGGASLDASEFAAIVEAAATEALN
jgi:triosephosphate isomerase (TIM)